MEYFFLKKSPIDDENYCLPSSGVRLYCYLLLYYTLFLLNRLMTIDVEAFILNKKKIYFIRYTKR